MHKKNNFQFYYILFCFFNSILNIILKRFFQQPRPSIDEKLFFIILKKNDSFVRRDGYPYDIFGMPSGHSQSVIYSTVFNFLVFRNFFIILPFLLISLITMIQRIVYNHHTLFQVIIGSFIGIIVAYIAFYFAKTKILGKINLKKDDNYFF